MRGSTTGSSRDRVVLCDVDEVVAGLLPEWIRRYNEQWDDALELEAIDRWDLTQLVVPECGNRIYEILNEPDVYDCVAPVPGAVEGVNLLRQLGYRVVFVTSSSAHTASPKLHWLHRHGFLPGTFGQRDVIIAHDKSLVCGDVLIDDGYHNVARWPGATILFDQPHNREFAHHRRAKSWDDVVTHVMNILG